MRATILTFLILSLPVWASSSDCASSDEAFARNVVTFGRGLRNGDKAAHALLYSQYHQAIEQFLERRNFPSSEIDDVVQETFIRFWNSRLQFDENRDPKPLLMTIARRVAAEFLRKRKDKGANKSPTVGFRLPIEEVDPMEREKSYATPSLAEVEIPFFRDIEAQVQAELRVSLSTLTPMQQVVFYFQMVDGLSVPETCQRLELEPKQVSALRFHAKEKIQKSFGSKFKGELDPKVASELLQTELIRMGPGNYEKARENLKFKRIFSDRIRATKKKKETPQDARGNDIITPK